MAYQVLKLFKTFGQYDKVCNVTLVEGSQSYQKYGTNITGDFFYKKDERQELQERLDNDDQNDGDANVKFIERLKNVSDEARNELLKVGFPISDIAEIFSFPDRKINAYFTEEVRSLPEPLVVKFNAEISTRSALTFG